MLIKTQQEKSALINNWERESMKWGNDLCSHLKGKVFLLEPYESLALEVYLDVQETAGRWVWQGQSRPWGEWTQWGWRGRWHMNYDTVYRSSCLRTLDFTLNVMRGHWSILRKEVTWSGLYFTSLILAILWKEVEISWMVQKKSVNLWEQGGQKEARR